MTTPSLSVVAVPRHSVQQHFLALLPGIEFFLSLVSSTLISFLSSHYFVSWQDKFLVLGSFHSGYSELDFLFGWRLHFIYLLQECILEDIQAVWLILLLILKGLSDVDHYVSTTHSSTPAFFAKGIAPDRCVRVVQLSSSA